jgi:hypothetical protein
MWEGTVKMSQEIREGDVLVGDDGMPRTVLGTICGVEELYEVKQTNGMSYVVTGEHTMVLLQKIQDTVIEMTVHQLITLPSATQSSLFGYNINRKKEESRLSIKPVGLGEFYGWKVDGNNRFLLKDGTILRNCDQVWCVTCRTPWDWATGKIVTKGAIHNPHYYEWLRRTGGEMPRNPADVPCGGYPNGYELRPIHYCASKRYARYFYEFHRICMELQDVTGQAYRSHLDERGLRDTHVRFLLGDFDEKTWGQRLAQAEKRRKRDAEIQDVFTAFRMVAVELLNRIQHYRDETVDTFTLLPLPQANAYLEAWHQEVLGLIHMVNDGLRGISLSHHCRVPYINIDDSLQRIHYYYTTRQWKEETVRKGKKKSDGEEVREEEELREEEVREEEEEVIEQEEKENGHRDEDEKKEDSDSEEDEEFQLALAIERSMTHS